MKIKLIEDGDNQDPMRDYQEVIYHWMVYKVMDDDDNIIGHVKLSFHADSYNENKEFDRMTVVTPKEVTKTEWI